MRGFWIRAVGQQLVGVGIAAAAAGCSGQTLPAEGVGSSSGGQAPGQSGSRIDPDQVSEPDVMARVVGEVPECDAVAVAPRGYRSVAVYHFEETQGADVLDASGVPREDDPMSDVGEGGTIVGGRRTDGRCGRGVTLEVAEAHLNISPVGPQFESAIAVGVWLRPASIATDEVHIVGDGGLGVATFQVVLDAGYPLFRLSPEQTGEWSEIMRSATPLVTDVWQYVEVAYEPGLGRMFVNGIEVASTDLVYPVAPSYNTISVGAVTNADPCCSYHREFKGDLDELAIFGR